MKLLTKITLSVITATCLCASANAQIHYGVKAGLNLANVAASGAVDSVGNLSADMLPTFHAGVFLNYALSDNFAIEPSLEVSGKGFKYEEEIPLFGGKVSLKSKPLFVQVPVMFQYQSSGFHIGAGPYVGFGVAGKNKSEAFGTSESDDIKFGSSVDDQYSALDFGLQAGLGYTLPMGLRFGATYGLGLTNAIPSDAREGQGKWSHRVIGISVGYVFGGMMAEEKPMPKKPMPKKK